MSEKYTVMYKGEVFDNVEKTVGGNFIIPEIGRPVPPGDLTFLAWPEDKTPFEIESEPDLSESESESPEPVLETKPSEPQNKYLIPVALVLGVIIISQL